jgi:hypothetical protein
LGWCYFLPDSYCGSWRSGRRVLGGWRQYLFVVAGLWFPLTFPNVQLPLFVIPNGRSSFVLLAAAPGLIQLLMGMLVRKQVGATPNPPKAP